MKIEERSLSNSSCSCRKVHLRLVGVRIAFKSIWTLRLFNSKSIRFKCFSLRSQKIRMLSAGSLLSVSKGEIEVEKLSLTELIFPLTILSNISLYIEASALITRIFILEARRSISLVFSIRKQINFSINIVEVLS